MSELLSICVPIAKVDERGSDLLRSLISELTDVDLSTFKLYIIDSQDSPETEESVLILKERTAVEHIRLKKSIDEKEAILLCCLVPDGEYCWILKKAELLREGAIKMILEVLEKERPALLLNNPGSLDKMGRGAKWSTYREFCISALAHESMFMLHTLFSANIFRKGLFDLDFALKKKGTLYPHLYGLAKGLHDKGGHVCLTHFETIRLMTGYPRILTDRETCLRDLSDFITWLSDYIGLPNSRPQMLLNAGRTGNKKVTVNFVYGHLQTEVGDCLEKGHVRIVWSRVPIEGSHMYVYHDAFSYTGKMGGTDALLMLEPVVVQPGQFDEEVFDLFDYVFTLFDFLAERGGKFIKIYFPRFDGKEATRITERLEERKERYPIKGRIDGICMINGNGTSKVPSELYSSRLELATWFYRSSRIPFHVYGWPPFDLPNYLGPVRKEDKLLVLSRYRYSLCFEDLYHPVFSAGYLTEKILDCLEARTVPIYFGCSNIERYVPFKSFIDYRKFKNPRSLEEYVRRISEKEYRRYVRHIDEWAEKGGLRRFSVFNLYDTVVKVYAKERSLDIGDLFQGASIWRNVLSGTDMPDLKTVKRPALWTWRHMSEWESPLYHQYERQKQKLSTNYSQIEKKPENGMRVLYIGTKYEGGSYLNGPSYEYVNIHDALMRCPNVELFTFDHVLEAKKNGIFGMIKRLKETVMKTKPHVFFYVPAGSELDVPASTLRELKEKGEGTILCFVDEKKQSLNVIRILESVHYVVLPRGIKDMAEKKRCEGNIIGTMWACNPFTHFPVRTDKKRDIGFIGRSTEGRKEIVRSLNNRGIYVETLGEGWPQDLILPIHYKVLAFGQTKINLSLNYTAHFSPEAPPRRLFEIASCRGFLIGMPISEIEKYFEVGKEMVIAYSLEDMEEKIRFYLKHEREMGGIAEHAYRKVLGEHTWFHRLKEIFDRMGLRLETPNLENPSDHSALFLQREDCDLGKTVEGLTSVCVMAFDGLEFTKKCVGSILHHTRVPYELILSDNGSQDGTYQYFLSVKKYHPNTRIIKCFKNRIAEEVGNHVLRVAKGEYIVAVTNDTIVHENWLGNLVDHLRSREDVGMVGPRSNNISGPQFLPAPYDSLEEYQAFAEELSKKKKGGNFEANRLVGMCVASKKRVYERVGGFDPDLPTNGRDGGYGFSDDDMSVRMITSGYRLLVCDDVYIHHFGSKTAGRYREDLFGVHQNVNKEKFLGKLRKNPLVTIGEDGKISLRRLSLNDSITVPPALRIRFPCFCVLTLGKAGSAFPAGARSSGFIKRVEYCDPERLHLWLLEQKDSEEYDYVVIVPDLTGVEFPNLLKLIDIALDYPDAAIIVPLYKGQEPATETDSHFEALEEANLSLSVLNMRVIRPFLKPLRLFENGCEAIRFLQRRIKGEGYEIIGVRGIERVARDTTTFISQNDYVSPEYLLRKGDLDGARSIYLCDLQTDPGFVYAYFQLAKIARAKGRSQEAIELLKRALKRDENYLDAYLELAEIYLSFCDLKNARSFLRAASFRHPSDLRVRQLTEKYEELLETYDMRCRLAETLHERAVELKKRGKIDETTEKLTLALTLNRGYGEAYNDLGVLYYLNGDYETARKFIELATQCSPDNLEYLKNLASVYLALGREEVIEIYERILSKTPDDAETLITLATLLKMVGKEEDAVSLLRVAAKVDPTYQGLKENLAIPQREGQL